MAGGPARTLARDLELIAGGGVVAGLTDADLLRRFASRRDATSEVAFEALVTRHGAMVLAVCRGILGAGGDADDAFQATFLVLVRKAGSVRVGDSLGPWLHGVACRVAVKARASARKRQRREATGTKVEAAAPTVGDPDGFDLRRLLHEELGRLPEKYRVPIVLCHLEGLTHEEAARRLGWPVGTVSGRLSRARGLLRDRLGRRGPGLAAPAVVAALAVRPASAVPPSLLGSTVQAATRFAAGGTVSATVIAMTRGVLTAMLLHKIKLGLIVASTVGLFAAGAGYVAGQAPRDEAPEAAKEAAERPEAERPGSPEKPAPARVQPPAGADEVRTMPIPGFPKFPRRGGEATRKMDIRPGGLGAFSDPIPVYQSPAFITVASPDGREVHAMDTAKGEWRTYALPEGVNVLPIIGGTVLALGLSGPEIRELVVFSTGEDDWSRQPLREPVRDGEVMPLPGFFGEIVVYQVGGDFYAYSAAAGRWDVLHPEGEGPFKFESGVNAALVQKGRMLYVFSRKTGRWSEGVEIKVKEDEATEGK